jgi:hypothetical protein
MLAAKDAPARPKAVVAEGHLMVPEDRLYKVAFLVSGGEDILISLWRAPIDHPC